MDSARPGTRVWVVPTIFALVGLSLPVQMYLAEMVGEPYPGLFQPAFSYVHQQPAMHRAIVLAVDGQVVDEEALFPSLNTGRRKALLESMFPPYGDSPQVDAAMRARMRSRLADVLDAKPRFLSATWERRRFDLDTQETSKIKTLSEYRIDLTEVDS